MWNAGDLAMEEEEVFGVPATDTAAPTAEDQEGSANGVLETKKAQQVAS